MVGKGIMIIKNLQDISATIRRVRKEKGLTQAELAAACGTGIRFIVDLEAAKPTISLTKTLRVLQILGVQLELKED